MDSLLSFLSSLSKIAHTDIRSMQELQSTQKNYVLRNTDRTHCEILKPVSLSRIGKDPIKKTIEDPIMKRTSRISEDNVQKISPGTDDDPKQESSSILSKNLQQKSPSGVDKDQKLKNLSGVNDKVVERPPGNDKKSNLGSPHKKRKRNIKSDKVWKVECCGTVFYHPSHVKRHQSTLLHLKSVKCYMCNATFTSKDELSNHEQNVHCKFGAVFICKFCNTVVSNRNSLSRHVINIHRDDRPFKCEKCPYSAKMKYLIERHIKRRHSENEKKIICENCGLRFENKSALVAHIKVVHVRNRVQCSTCFKTFDEQKDLDLHIRCHLPGKNFFCQVCGRSFKTVSHRERHFVTHTRPPKRRKSLNSQPSHSPSGSHQRETLHDSHCNSRLEDEDSSASNDSKGDEDATMFVEEDIGEGFNDEFTYVDVESVDDQDGADSVYILPDAVEVERREVSHSALVSACTDSSPNTSMDNHAGSPANNDSVGSDFNSLNGSMDNHYFSEKIYSLTSSSRELRCSQVAPMKTQVHEATVISSSQGLCYPSKGDSISEDSISKSKTRNAVGPILANAEKRERSCSNFSQIGDSIGSRDQSSLFVGDAPCMPPVSVEKGSDLPSKIDFEDDGLKLCSFLSKEQGISKKIPPRKLREITSQECNLPKDTRNIHKLPLETEPQLESNSSQESRHIRLPNTPTVYAQGFKDVESTPAEALRDGSHGPYTSHCSPHISDRTDVLPLENSCVPLVPSRRKQKEKTFPQKKRSQNSNNSKLKDCSDIPHVYVTNVCDESDVFLLPEFFTEEDAENMMPSEEGMPTVLVDEELSVILAASSSDFNDISGIPPLPNRSTFN